MAKVMGHTCLCVLMVWRCNRRLYYLVGVCFSLAHFEEDSGYVEESYMTGIYGAEGALGLRAAFMDSLEETWSPQSHNHNKPNFSNNPSGSFPVKWDETSVPAGSVESPAELVFVSSVTSFVFAMTFCSSA